MHLNPRKITSLAAFIPLFCGVVVLAADVSIRSRVVDAVVLHDGTRLLGTVKQPVGDQSLSLLMRADWLRQFYPAILNTLNSSGQNPHDATAEAIRELTSHLKLIDPDRDKSMERAGFLREQIERLQLQKKADPNLVLLRIPTEKIRRRFLQPLKRRSIAFAAILNNVVDAEVLTEPELRRHMSTLPPESLLTQLPEMKRPSMSAAERILINADRLFGTVTRLIRHGDRYFSEANDANRVTVIAAQFLSDGLSQQLRQLLSEPTISADQSKPSLHRNMLNATAVRIANAEGADLVELTSMQISPLKGVATVTIEIYRLRGDGNWHQVLLASAKATSQETTAQQHAQIEKDPRLEQVLGLFESLGATPEISRAVAVGAIVQVAQRRANQELTRQLSADNQSPVVLECTFPATFK